MHQAAYTFVKNAIDRAGGTTGKRVLEVGSYNVNGTVRPLFQAAASYLGIDRRDGPDVDLVVDVADFQADAAFDLFVSCGSIEHSDDPAQFFRCAERVLAVGGWLILHGEGDRPHNQDGGKLSPGETYRVITPELLGGELGPGWAEVEIWQQGHDVFCVARWDGTPEPEPDPDAVTETPATAKRRRARAKNGGHG